MSGSGTPDETAIHTSSLLVCSDAALFHSGVEWAFKYRNFM